MAEVNEINELAAFLRARLGEDQAAALTWAERDMRPLREVAAKRTLVTIYTEQDGYDLPSGVNEGRDPDERERDQALLEAFEDTLRILGQVYADHPDYRPEWRWDLSGDTASLPNRNQEG